jgi:hypothetical protein
MMGKIEVILGLLIIRAPGCSQLVGRKRSAFDLPILVVVKSMVSTTVFLSVLIHPRRQRFRTRPPTNVNQKSSPS